MDSSSNPPIEHRRINRRTVNKGTAVTCRKGVLGLGPDLAIRILDMSESGARLVVGVELVKGDEIELSLTPLGMNKPKVLMAVVEWCYKSKDSEGYWVGATFSSTLTYGDVLRFL